MGVKGINKTHGFASDHGRHPLYSAFHHMKARCYCKANPKYKDYGGRGITICDEWLNSSVTFIQWAIANGWQRGLQIDRINNDGNYGPSNCRFVIRKINMRNTRRNRMVEAFNEIKNVTSWLEDSRCVVNEDTLRSRLKSGWSSEDALTTHPRKRAT